MYYVYVCVIVITDVFCLYIFDRSKEKDEASMILHIFNDQKKFSKGYFRMLKDYNFDIADMELIHYGKRDDFFSKEIGINCLFIRSFFSIFGNIKMVPKLIKAEKIVVHSLASPALLLYLSMSKQLQKKVTWVIWGKDLYFYKLSNKKTIFHEIYEWFRKRCFKNIGVIVTILEGDYTRLKEWYDVNGKYIECNDLYHYAVDTKIGEIRSNEAENKVILLGNSGSVTNRHIEALEKIKNFSNIEKIYCPLSYGGNKKYYQKVIAYGKDLFGEKFIPLTDFMPREEYESMLNSVDVGIFNYNRQEGLGNIWMLMFMGKTIYLNKETATGEFFDKLNIKYFDFSNKTKDKKIEVLEKKDLKRNQEILHENINVERSVQKWREILYE